MKGSIRGYSQFAYVTAIILALFLIAVSLGSACPLPIWYPYEGIDGSIDQPVNGSEHYINSEVACSISAADLDSRCYNNQWTYHYDELTYTWSATGGSWKNGVNTGTSVIWVAPSTPSDGITIRCTVKDKADIPEGETGNRNDEDAVCQITVKVIIPPAVWDTYTDITGGNITAPTNGSILYVDDEVTCSITSATDQDSRYYNNQWTYPSDTADIYMVGNRWLLEEWSKHRSVCYMGSAVHAE